MLELLQAHAWVALGKFCLVDEPTAKKCVPLFVQELGRATNPAVRFHQALSHAHPTKMPSMRMQEPPHINGLPHLLLLSKSSILLLHRPMLQCMN